MFPKWFYISYLRFTYIDWWWEPYSTNFDSSIVTCKDIAILNIKHICRRMQKYVSGESRQLLSKRNLFFWKWSELIIMRHTFVRAIRIHHKVGDKWLSISKITEIKLSNQIPLCSEPKELTLKLIVTNIWFYLIEHLAFLLKK